MIPRTTVFTKLVNCRVFNYFLSKTGNVAALDAIDYCARR